MKNSVSLVEVEKVYGTSPVPILEYSWNEWKEFCKENYFPNPRSPNSGIYYYNTPEKYKLPKDFIVVDRKLANYKRIAVFFHELGHHTCLQKDCCCYKADNKKQGICELHATLFCLKACLVGGYRSSLFFAMRCVCSSLIDADDVVHNGGARLTVEHSIWNESKDMLGDEFEQWVSKRDSIRSVLSIK